MAYMEVILMKRSRVERLLFGDIVKYPTKYYVLYVHYGIHGNMGECYESMSKVYKFRRDYAGSIRCQRLIDKLYMNMSEDDDSGDITGSIIRCKFNEEYMVEMWDNLSRYGYLEPYNCGNRSLHIHLGYA